MTRSGLYVRLALVLAGVLASPTAFAGKPSVVAPVHTRLAKGETGQVRSVYDGDSFTLASGLWVELAAIKAPKRASKKSGAPAQPLAKQARAALGRLIGGKEVHLYYSGDRRDRYERAQAQVFTSAQNQAGLWVQKAMVEQGLAYVYPWNGDGLDFTPLYEAEQKARQARRGIWNSKVTNGFYDIRTPDPNGLAQMVDTVQIVEGIIVSVADVRGTIYMNFGADYKTDFTIAIAKKNRKAFKNPKQNPLSLAGARVRVRGYIELSNGPVIWLDSPARLEILD
ncbi:MAG TPA: hypothetical protein ENJ42_00435 [Hellea balneolensis]|uniref:TNase-like domain-containing protein n=1 Tax=Hellea balneolensis TaxID=287478 RepID=A0A7C5LRF7_9PROT|nr:hypothetical protein [Hellea balneolensis]